MISFLVASVVCLWQVKTLSVKLQDKSIYILVSLFEWYKRAPVNGWCTPSLSYVGLYKSSEVPSCLS